MYRIRVGPVGISARLRGRVFREKMREGVLKHCFPICFSDVSVLLENHHYHGSQRLPFCNLADSNASDQQESDLEHHLNLPSLGHL